MSFTVQDFLRLEPQIQPICGLSGMNNEIRGAAIIEAPDIVKYINGGELLLTGLYAFKSCSMEEFRFYIDELKLKKISAIIVKLGREVEDSDKKIAYLQSFSRENSIPLLVVPLEESLQRILCSVMEYLFNDEITRLKYFKTTHDNFSAITLSEKRGENRVQDIIDMLSKMIDNPAALYDKNMVCYAACGTEDTEFEILPDVQQYDTGMLTKNKYFSQTSHERQYIVQITLSFGSTVFLVITDKKGTFNHIDCIAIENAVFALQNEFSNNHAVTELEKKYRDDILYNLLHGNMTDINERNKNINLLGLDTNECYRVLLIGIKYETRRNVSFDEMLADMDFLEDTVRHTIPEGKLYQDFDRIAVLMPEQANRTQLEYRSRMQEYIAKIDAQIKQRDKKRSVKAGAGKLVNGMDRIPDSYAEATDAFLLLDIVGDIVGRDSLMLFSDLGIFKLLCQIDDENVLMEYVPDSLKRLHNYKKSQRDDLILTLKTYLDRKQNLSKTAQDLFIHYKTAVYRMDKITQIMEIDFSNANEVLAVRIGLVVYQMIEKMRDGR